MEEQSFETTNINAKVLDNLFENIVRLEQYDRLARNGVQSTNEYILLLTAHGPERVKIMIPDIQYKNLKNMINEVLIIIPELKDIMDEKDIESLKFRAEYINEHMNNRQLFVDEGYSSSKNVVASSTLTPIYYKVLNEVADMRAKILKGLAPIRHIVKKESKPSILR